MSLQPGSAYVNYLAVKKLLPLDEQANQYPSTTIFAVDSSGALAGYDPATWFSTIGMPNPSTLQAEIVSTIGIIDAGLSSTLYGLVSTSQIVNQYILASSLSSTVAGLAATTGVSQAQLDNRIKNLAAEGYVSSTQLTSTVAGLGTAGYLSTSTDGTLHVKALSTGSVSLSTLALIDIAAPTSKKLLYNNGGGLYFGETLLGGAITDLSLNTLDVSNATVYADLTVGGSITAPITYSETLSTLVVNAQKNPTDRTWAVAGYFPSEGDYGVQFSSNNGITWDLSAHLFSGTVNQIKYLNGIWFGLGKYGILNGTDYKGIYYTINNGLTWIAPSGFVNTNVFDIAYNGSYYVLVSDTGVYTSPNGTSWTLSPSSPITFQCITYNGIYWVAAGSSTIGYSVDGVSWSNASGSFGSPNFKAIAYNGHTLVVANTNSGNIFYSDDKGLSWTAVAVGGTQVPSVTWNGSYFLVGTFSPYGLYYSRDGRSWTQSPTTPSETVTSIFWNGRITYGVGTTNTYQTTDGITWTQSAKTYNVNSPTSISYSVYVGDDIIGGNIRYYGVDIPHYYDSTNQLYAGPDRLLLNNTLTVKDGFVGIMKGDPTVHLDVQGAARASTFAASTLQLADMNGETTLTGNGGMLLINNIPIVQSTVAGLGQTYVSIPSLRSTVEGLGTAGYVSSLSLASTVQGLGTFGYVSSLSLASTVQGLGTYGYVSSQSLASTVAGLGTAGYVSSQSLASTVAGLGTAGYVSSQSLASTVAGLGTAGYVSSQSLASTVAGLGTAGYVSSQSLASTVAGLGTAGYVSSQSLASTVAGLGTAGYISSLSLASTVGSLLTNLQVSSFAASTITFAKLFTSTVYVGNNNLSTNLIRFYGTTDDGNTVGQYGHTVIGERVYNAPSQSELLFFKGNDGFATTDVDRIRHLAGSHQFDIINRSDNTSIWYDGFENPPEPDINAALFINTIGNIGIGTTTPARPLHVRPLNDSGVVRLDRVTGSGPAYHMHYFDASGDTVPYKGFSMHIDDVSGANTGKFIIGDLQQQVAGFNALPRIVVDSSGNVGIGTATPSYNLDVSGRLIIRNGTGRVISSDASGNFSVGSSMSNFGAVMEVVNGTLVPNPAPSVNFPHLSLRGAYDTVGKGQFWVDGGFNDQKLNIQSLRATSLTSYNGNSLILNPIGGNVGIGTTTPSYSLDVCGSFYASTINYAKLYTSTVYVGNDNASTNMIRFYGTHEDNQLVWGGIYSHTVIAERIYDAPEDSELLLFKGNDRNTGNLDRIRHLAGAHQFDIISQPSSWPDTSANPPAAGISAALYVDNTGKVGVGTTSPGASLDVSGSFISRLKFVDIASGAASFTLNTTHYGAYIYLQSGFNNAITLPTGGSAPPDGTVVVIINNSGNNINITAPGAGNTSGTITSGTTRTFAYHTTGPVWIGL